MRGHDLHGFKCKTEHSLTVLLPKTSKFGLMLDILSYFEDSAQIFLYSHTPCSVRTSDLWLRLDVLSYFEDFSLKCSCITLLVL